MLRRYEQPWRPAYEAVASVAWLIGAAYFFWEALQSLQPLNLLLALSIICVAMAALRARQGLKVLVLRASLAGRAMEIMTHSQLRRLREIQQKFSSVRLRVATETLTAPLRPAAL